MIYILLVALFIAVFGFITWRVFLKSAASGAHEGETYVCPVCNEQNCICEQKKDTPGGSDE